MPNRPFCAPAPSLDQRGASCFGKHICLVHCATRAPPAAGPWLPIANPAFTKAGASLFTPTPRLNHLTEAKMGEDVSLLGGLPEWRGDPFQVGRYAYALPLGVGIRICRIQLPAATPRLQVPSAAESSPQSYGEVFRHRRWRCRFTSVSPRGERSRALRRDRSPFGAIGCRGQAQPTQAPS